MRARMERTATSESSSSVHERRRWSVREYVRVRANGMCEICGIEVDPLAGESDPNFPTMHHRWPRRLGGIDHNGNLLQLCVTCHRTTVHGDESRAFILGWMANRNDYATTPVLTYFGWVTLKANGTYGYVPYWEVARLERLRANTDAINA